MASTEKVFFTYNDIHNTIKKLSEQIQESGYEPDLIVAIGTGGFIPARIIKTYIKKPILTVGLKLYDENNQPKDTPEKIQWIDEVEKKLKNKKILLVDEVDDSRTTLEYCLKELLRAEPAEIAVAVLHDKEKEKRGSIPAEIKRYFYGAKLPDKWICYPWDAIDIDKHGV
ncbi:MAG: phosphoribosyltransferase family protein [Spirochaetales bacterium]|nr:phosphoribosyltransferase family protein [Spirochaetales bacterium]